MNQPNAKNRILAPVQENDGCSFYRIQTPSKKLLSWQIDLPVYQINKFKPAPRRWGIQPLDRLVGSWWDRRKLAERKRMVGRLSDYDAFWLSRSLLSFKNSADTHVDKLIYDVDDAIWTNGEANHCFEHHCRRALVVLAGNQFIADHASSLTKNIEVVPTSVDMDYHVSLNLTKNRFNVGWIGSAAGLSYLVDISDQLIAFFKQRPDAKMVVVTERPPVELGPLLAYTEYVPWTRAGEVHAINQFSIGLMPLRDTVWERGKCSFKMLQYMACGVPAVVSPVGMNVEVLNREKEFGTFALSADNNWIEVLQNLYQASDSHRAEMGTRGRRAAQVYYSTDRIAQELDRHFLKYIK